jgi:hypothetical protein
MRSVSLPGPADPNSVQRLLREHQVCAVTAAQAAANSETKAVRKGSGGARQLQA